MGGAKRLDYIIVQIAKLTVVLSCPSRVAIVDVKTPEIFVLFVLCPHNHKLVDLIFFACHPPGWDKEGKFQTHLSDFLWSFEKT